MARKDFDSGFCGSLPLNNTNLIQDYGYLLIVDRDNLDLVQVSENSHELCGKTPDAIVQTRLPEYITTSQLETIRSLEDKGLKDKVPLILTINGTDRAVMMHVREKFFLFEVEKNENLGTRLFSAVFNEIKYAISAIETAETVEEVSKAAIHELKKISGFDGVLMYRFDKSWNGKVIAEEKTPDLEPYLGQTFPASDIPKQARDLYLKNPYRQIPDGEYEPHGLYPIINPLTNAFLDLSDCNLRSVPSVHREYMRNMGIRASMSIRVLRNDELWGLISCHHIAPKYIDFEMCAIFEMLSTIISSKITSILHKEEFDQTTGLQAARLSLSDEIFRTADLGQSLLRNEENNALSLFGAAGAVMTLNGEMEFAGNTPPRSFIENLVFWLDSKELRNVFSSDNLPGVYEDAMQYKDTASGIIVIPVDSRRSEYIICFRPEVRGEIDWGGNPNDAIRFDSDGKNYHPRNSFALWKERVENYSKPWSEQEIDTAAALGSFLYEFRTRASDN